jgi:hypothetical protein
VPRSDALAGKSLKSSYREKCWKNRGKLHARSQTRHGGGGCGTALE